MYICLSTPIWLLGAGKGKVKSHRSTKTYCQGRYSHVPSFLSTSDVCLWLSYCLYEIRNKTHTEINIYFTGQCAGTDLPIHAQRTLTRIHTRIHALTCTQPSHLPPLSLYLSYRHKHPQLRCSFFICPHPIIYMCTQWLIAGIIYIYICTRIYKGIKKNIITNKFIR